MTTSIMNQQLKVSRKLFELAKHQYNSGKITKTDYLETLELILKRLDKEELKFEQLSVLESLFHLPSFNIDIKETISHALSMN